MSERNSEQWLTLEEAAEQRRCNTRTLRRQIADGKLRGYRFGDRLIRVRQDDLDALMRPIKTAGSAA